ncbi:MAG TPA: Clp protease N-terminal domain-containing protein [Gaiellaceae bacterium]|nr:Clp protease N-terminal domain-containing protein [Gaiellaceae bacterium]
MMTLDEQVLAEAREVRQRLVDLESQTAHARVDYHHAIKKLHAAGGSLREIADALELSHQRVHQIVEGPVALPMPPVGRPGWKHRGRRHGRRRRDFFMARFDDGAKEVMVQAQQEADALKHNYVGTEHLLLAILRRGAGGLDVEAARKAVVDRTGEGEEPWIAGLPRPLTPRAKRALEAALAEAESAGREQFGPEDILLAIASDPKGTGGEVLADLDVTPEQLRERLGR